MNSKLLESLRFILPIGILLVGFAGFGAMKSLRKPPTLVEEEAKPLLVETAAIVPFESTLDIETDGLVTPHREIALAAEVAGRVTFKAPECRNGHYVKKGDLLVEIDPQTYQLEVERLALELEQAKATLAELGVEQQNVERLATLAESQLELQKKNTERAQTLMARKVSTDANLDEALRAELTARNNLQTLKNEVEMISARRARLEQARDLAATRLKQAQLDVDRTRIAAPIDGVIVAEAVEQNSYVQPGAALVTIEDTSAVEARCNLRMEELRWVLEQAAPNSLSSTERDPETDYQLPRTPVTIVYRFGDTDYSWQGKLTRYDGIGLDERTRTVPVRVLIEDPRAVSIHSAARESSGGVGGPRALVRGMFVKAVVHVQPRTRLLKVPERSIQPGGVIWCVRENRLKILPVRTAVPLESEDAVLIEADDMLVQAGDRVVTSPIAVPVEDMIVREESTP